MANPPRIKIRERMPNPLAEVIDSVVIVVAAVVIEVSDELVSLAEVVELVDGALLVTGIL